MAAKLHNEHNLPDLSHLLRELNELRKSEAYEEVPPPRSLAAEDVAVDVENYITDVAVLIGDTE